MPCPVCWKREVSTPTSVSCTRFAPGVRVWRFDLLEELRHSVVDRFVLRACNLRQLRPEHFETDAERGGVRLTRDGLRTFFRAWEAFMDAPLAGVGDDIAPEDILRRQADRLAAHVRGHEPYRPLLLGQS